jgi:hypothetical protein
VEIHVYKDFEQINNKEKHILSVKYSGRSITTTSLVYVCSSKKKSKNNFSNTKEKYGGGSCLCLFCAAEGTRQVKNRFTKLVSCSAGGGAWKAGNSGGGGEKGLGCLTDLT